MAKAFGSKLERTNQRLTENRLINRAIAIIRARDVKALDSHIQRMLKHSKADAARLLSSAFQRSKPEDLQWWKDQGVALATNLELQTDVG
jgi:hypothetical protein